MRKCFYGYSQNTTGPSYCPKSTLCNDQQVIITSIWWWWDHHHNQPVIIESPSSFALSTTLNSCWHIFYYPFAFYAKTKTTLFLFPSYQKIPYNHFLQLSVAAKLVFKRTHSWKNALTAIFKLALLIFCFSTWSCNTCLMNVNVTPSSWSWSMPSPSLSTDPGSPGSPL